MTQLAEFEGRNPLAKVMNSKALEELDSLVREHNPLAVRDAGPFKRALAMASTVSMLRERLSNEMMGLVMPLQNVPLGFLTDNRQGYSVDVVRDVMIEATLRGAQMVGNEVNIISGRCYLTKEFFTRAVREFPGLTDLSHTLSVPRVVPGGAEVDGEAKWRIEGNQQTLKRTFPIKVNNGMGGDAILGKATRKLFAAIYGRLTGSEHAYPEGEVEEVSQGNPAADLNRRLKDMGDANVGEAGAGREVVLPPAPAPTPSQKKAEDPPFADKPGEDATPRKSLGDANAQPPDDFKGGNEDLMAAFDRAGKGVRR